MKILIIRLSAIGDVIHGLPVISAIKKQYPEAVIGWVVEELSAPFLLNHPLIDKLYIIPKKRWRGNFRKYFFPEIMPFIKSIRAEKWDCAIDFQGLSKSGIISYASGAARRIGFAGKDSREINFLFSNKKIKPPSASIHVVEKNLSLLSAVGINNPEIKFTLVNAVEEKKWADDYLKSLGWENDKVAMINVGGGWETKIIPPEILAESARKIYKEFAIKALFIWGPREEYLIDKIKSAMPQNADRFWEIAPMTKLLQLMELIKRGALYIGGDTGPTHIAAAAGIPVVSFFGASDSKRNGPYSDKTKIIQHFEIECVPCWKTKCPFTDDKKFICLKSISSDEILANARLLLKGPQYQQD